MRRKRGECRSQSPRLGWLRFRRQPIPGQLSSNHGSLPCTWMHFLASPLTRWLQDFLDKWLISKQLRLYGIQEVTGSISVSSTENQLNRLAVSNSCSQLASIALAPASPATETPLGAR